MKQAYPAFLLSLTLLAGCGSVGPDYSAPVLPAAQRATSFGAPIAGLGAGAGEVQWWPVVDAPALSPLSQTGPG
ncbi:TolC family protein, partial [Pseudomonas carnis]|nr:TolC family protein [Pseudomonas carnis]